jgi:septum formation protein
VLVLASRSPRRRAILDQLGVEFRVEVPEVEELDEGDPRELVLENARRKAAAVEGELVLGVDTAVVLEGRAFGKPRDAHEAEGFLRALSGRDHEVMSGISVRDADGEERSEVVVTRVRFRQLDDRTIDWYLSRGEWGDCAGGYAIQGKGAALVEEIEGDYWNVVGLPVPALLRLAPDVLG